MQRLRFASRLILLLALLVTLPALVVANLALRREIGHARDLYEHARNDLKGTEGRLVMIEGRLTRLTTSPNAVEQEARTRLRLVRPGETLVLLNYE